MLQNKNNMKIRHKLTGEEREIIFNTWRTTIQNKENYEILDRGDVIYLRQIEKEGYRKYLYQIDKDHAIKMIKKHPHLYDFQELNDLPFEVQARLILEELKWKEGRKGDLGKILNDLKIDFIGSDLKEFAKYLKEKGWAGTTLTKDANPIQATRKGLESLRVPLPLVKPLEAQGLEPDKTEPLTEPSAVNVQEDEQKKSIKFRKTESGLRSEQKGKSWFFGIGINEYKHFTDLHNAVGDVKAIYQELQENYDINEVIMLFDKQATRRNIIRKLDELVREVKSEDKLLIHYSGHGHLSTSTKGYWIPHDAELNYTDDYIANSRLRDYMEDIKARHILLISDSCFSGSLFAQGSKRKLPEPEDVLESKVSRYALCSGRHDEEVHDGKPGENSPFVGSILEGLRENSSPKLRISLLAEQVMSRTASKYRQLPQHGTLFDVGDKGGQYIFRRKQKQVYHDPEDEFWNQCIAENTIEALSKYLHQFPNGRFANEAIEKIKKCERDDEAWEKAIQSNRISSYHEYLRGFPDGLYKMEAKSRIENLEKEKTASRIDHKRKTEPLIKSSPKMEFEEKEEFYADLAKLPHQKGKWAVFKDGAQMQGTVKATKEEAQSLADGLNNKTREHLTLSNGAHVLENGKPFFGTDQLPSWKYYDEKEGVEGVVLVYLSSMDQIKVVKPDTWNLPEETIERIESEVNKEKVQLLKIHGIDR